MAEPLLAGGGEKAAAKGVVGTAEKLATRFNVKRLNVAPEVRQAVTKTVENIRPELEKVVGKTLSNEEVVNAAKSSDILRSVTSREATLKEEAAILKTRQHLAAMAKDEKVTAEMIDTIRILKSTSADRGRQLQALSIGADPELHNVKTQMIGKITEIEKDTDKILRAAEGVDFNNAEEAAKFYRTFIKPTMRELLDEYRYINMLSSPKTHIVNAFSNILQGTVVRPATRLASGVIDAVGSTLRGTERQYYVRQVPAYYKGFFNGTGEAVGKALRVLSGKER